MPNESILVVEDTPVNMKVVRVLLTRHGFDVRTAATAEEALDVLQQFHPGLILTDVQLPGMSGLELTRKLKSDPSTRDIIVLALTAFAMKRDEKNAYDAGCDGYITKPIDTRTFPDLIRKYLIKASQAQSQSAPEPQAVAPPAQQSFLAEGMEQSGRLIASLGSSFDPAEALSVVRRWAGMAAPAGKPEIGYYARELETLLLQNGRGSMVRTRELLVRLARAFAEGMA